MTAHAVLSPSKAHRWIPCPGSIVLEEGRPDVERDEQAEGTMLHAASAAALLGIQGVEPVAQLASEQQDAVDAYVNAVREYAAVADSLYVEKPVGVGHFTGEEGAQGTPDAVIVIGNELQIHDAKFGRVRVSAERNPQLMLYALGAQEHFAHLVFERIRLVIHQPRLGAVDEWVCSPEELRTFAESVKAAARAVDAAKLAGSPISGAFLSPGPSQCQYCRAKAVCPALKAEVERVVGANVAMVAEVGTAPHEPKDRSVFSNTVLSESKKAVPLIRLWCDAVDEEVSARMLAGEQVPGFKLVKGKRFARQWVSEEEAEKTLKAFRLNSDEMYTRKLVSPTQAEERAQRLDKNGALKPGDEARPIKPRQWQKLQPLIAQPEGRLQVAPESDKRPAVQVNAAADDFKNETLSDLLE